MELMIRGVVVALARSVDILLYITYSFVTSLVRVLKKNTGEKTRDDGLGDEVPSLVGDEDGGEGAQLARYFVIIIHI